MDKTSNSSSSSSEDTELNNSDQAQDSEKIESPKKRKAEKDENPRPKKKRKNYKTIEDGYLLHITGVDSALISSVKKYFLDDDMMGEFPNCTVSEIDRQLIRVLLNKDEKKKIARDYRKSYSQRKKDEMKDVALTEEQVKKIEEMKKKRKDYNATEEVKERKKLKLKADKELLKYFSEKYPNIVQEKYDQIIPKKERKKKASIAMKEYE